MTGRLLADGGMVPGASPVRRLAAHGGSEAIPAMLPVIGRAVAFATAVGGLTLLGRRLSGGFAMAPTPLLTCGVVVGGLALVTATDLLTRPADKRTRLLARGGLLTAALAAVPLAGGLATLAGLAAAVSAAVVALRPLLPAARSRRRAGFAGGPGIIPSRPEATAPHPVKRSPPLEQPAPAELGDASADGLRQRLERLVTAAGDDCLRGRLLVTVAAGSRSGHAHVGFCPAFAAIPAVDVTTDCDFVEADLTAAEILPWGVRVECRLSEPAEETLEIPVDLVASVPSVPSP